MIIKQSSRLNCCDTPLPLQFSPWVGDLAASTCVFTCLCVCVKLCLLACMSETRYYPLCFSLWVSPLAGCSGRGSHPELPAGEITCRTPEPRWEELPHFLSAHWRGRGWSAEEAGPGEERPTVPVSGEGETDLTRLFWLQQMSVGKKAVDLRKICGLVVSTHASDIVGLLVM